ncbi:Hypothetical protein D9617_27g044390 [Elsinoe fawcettii]|nr:Hypothetical protein D9617_27g044390 [Elsinoe fawcettii]
MWEKLVYFRDKADDYRLLLMQEPRGKVAQCMNMILAPCNPKADAGFLTLESDEYPPMSGGNTICTATVLLETGMIEMKEPITEVTLDAAAGLITVEAECYNGKCKNVAFTNVPSFVHVLDHKVQVHGVGKISVDIAWGGMHYAIVDVSSVGLQIRNEDGPELIRIGEEIKKAVRASFTPVHPENPDIKGVTIVEFTEPVKDGPGGNKVARNTVVVSPGRFDRCPCGTGSSARLAVLHARGELEVGQTLVHRSIIDSEFQCKIKEKTKVGDFDAVVPVIKGRAWLTGFRQVMLDPEDPYPTGYRVGDHWPTITKIA